MKHVVFGLTISSSWGNGHATLWRGLSRALARRGHRIVFFERDVPYYAAHRDGWGTPGVELRLYADWGGAAAAARRELADADTAIVTSYCPDAVAASELALASPARLRVFYDLDTPVTLERLRAGESVGYIGERGLRDYDLVLSFSGGRSLAELRERLGARRAVPLYNSVDPDVHRPAAPAGGYRADLSYLGTYADDRQAALLALFIEPARLLPRRRFVLAGAQYPCDFPWTDNIFFVRHIPPAAHPVFFSSSRLTLNVTRRAMVEMGHCPSGRLFEAAACGAPILSDWWEGIGEFLEPGREVLIARDADGAIACIERSDEELARIGRAARERTLEEHTADRRAREFEEILAGARDPGPAITPAQRPPHRGAPAEGDRIGSTV